MTCSDVRANLHLFVGGDLEHPEDGAVRAHLEACEACREESRRAVAARRALLGVRAVAPTEPAIWEGVRARLLAEGALTPDGTLFPASRVAAATRETPAPTFDEPAPVRHLWRLAGGLAAAAALALGLWAVTPDHRPAAPQPFEPDDSMVDGPRVPTDAQPVADRAPAATRQATQLRIVPPDQGFMDDSRRPVSPEERQRQLERQMQRDWLQRFQELRSAPGLAPGDSKAASNRRVW